MCHDYDKLIFTENLKSFIHYRKYVKNHLIVGDLNIDITLLDDTNQTYL